MKKTILLTGITGFIGKKIAEHLLADFDITAIIRPNTDIKRYSDFIDFIKIEFLDLSSHTELQSYLNTASFDYILHFAALRGGRKATQKDFYDTNLISTELLINNAIKNKSKFIFCSSVGVYGAIPYELPATLSTPYISDNLYHSTKILCEQVIHAKIASGLLDACIVRPAITYGKGDYGFPYTLTKLVSKGLMVLPSKEVFIHLTNVETVAELVSKMLSQGFQSGSIYNVADTEKVSLRALVDFIYNAVGTPFIASDSKKYPRIKTLPIWCFQIAVKLTKLLRNELWTSRFQLISNSWYFDIQPVYEIYNLKQYHTIPYFQTVIDWYKGVN